MQTSNLLNKLAVKEISITLKHILDNSKAESGGERDVKFLKYLIDEGHIIHGEVSLKRTNLDINEEYYLERYKKMSYESDRHFLCRTVIQDEFKKLGFETFNGMDVGNLEILRSNSNYDIVTLDFQNLIDIGLSPARNYFRGLTDLKTKAYLLTSFFDDYQDDILFSFFVRGNDNDFINAIRDYEEGFKIYPVSYDSFTSQEKTL